MSLYGRDDATWERLTSVGLDFLVERARIENVTTYTELNATLVRRTGFPGFDFDREDERAAMGRLLGLIVERNYPATGLMISALVRYLDANDAGPGFYDLATRMGLLGRNPSKSAKMEFWVGQVRSLHRHYSRFPNPLTS
ncbi:hypothetical protein O7598_28505 [Micromonospora sp. WMMC241]|uniref:hypothetical protein n=1 Tax=Micromonospora sp. WMMC241 TaxID=3015159 RepID=UPI0022B68E0B|nr:hypothetical protein [Micromonospora sp. WMMC241]MCZ7440368.1 hypothetical protein [Micromonospora sp. WMMC241]